VTVNEWYHDTVSGAVTILTEAGCGMVASVAGVAA
jgi:hypothetical protein